MLQDHGRPDARQGPDHEEDSQAAADLLQVQKLTDKSEKEEQTADVLKSF